MPSIKKYNVAYYCLIFLLVLLNMTRNIENDLQNYLSVFFYSSDHTIVNTFLSQKMLFKIKLTEPIFPLLTVFLSRLLLGKAYLYIGFLTFIFYSSLNYGTTKLLELFKIDRNKYLFYLLIFIFGCVNFSETSHLLRQFLAGSFVPLFIYYLLSNKYLNSFLLGSFMVLTHNSFLVVLVILLTSYGLFNAFRKNNIVAIAVWILFYGFFLSAILNLLDGFNYNDQQSSLTTISLYFDSILIIVFLLVKFLFGRKIPQWTTFIFIFTLCYFVFLYSLTYSATLFLRFYLNIEWFRFFYFLIILEYFPLLRISRIVKPVVLLLVLLIFTLRLYVSPWEFFNYELFS